MTTADTQAVVTPTDFRNGEAGRLCVQRLVSRQWQNVTMINADCLDIGHCAGEVQVVITDPPYGTGKYELDCDSSVITKLEPWHRKAVFGYPETLVRWCLKLGVPDEWITWWPTNKHGANCKKLPRESEAIAIWGEMNEQPRRPRAADKFTRKLAAQRGLDVETAREGDVWRDYAPGTGANKRQRIHPNEKPEVLMIKLVRLCSWEGETVLDPYAGSGTTAIACIRTGRKFIGIEKDPRHYKTACDRIAHELDGALL